MNSRLLSVKVVLPILLLVIGLVVAVFLIQQQSELRQRATNTNYSVTAVCSASNTVALNVSYTNSSDIVVDVTATDVVSGKSVALGSIAAGATANGQIVMDGDSIEAGSVQFILSNGETKVGSYNAFTCTGVPACPVSQARCLWDPLANTTQYNVVVKESETNIVVEQEVVNHPTTQLVFQAEPGKSYTCEVTAENSCGIGEPGEGTGESCPVPTPTVVPSDVPTVTPESSLTPTTPASSSTPTVGPSATPTTVQSNSPTPTTGINSTPTTGTTTSVSPTLGGIGGADPFTSATPTPLTELPATGLADNILAITVIGTAIALLGSFLVIFL